MAIPNLLVSRSRVRTSPSGENNARVYELVGGTELRQIGSTIAKTCEAPDDGDSTRACLNRVIEFKGERYFYHQNEIRKENQGGSGLWGVVHTTTSQNTSITYAEHTGLYNVQVNGVNTLVAIYFTTSNTIAATRSSDGSTWTDVVPIAGVVDSATMFGKSIVFRNQLYTYVDHFNGPVIRYNPQTDTGAFITANGGILNGANAHDFAVHNNNLFMVGTSAATVGDITYLYQLIGSNFDRIYTFSAVDNGGTNEGSCPLLFSDGTDLIAIIPGRSGGNLGDTAFRIQNPGTGSQTVTDITATILPGTIQPGGSQGGELSHWYAFVNTDTNPASSEIYLFRYNNLNRSSYTQSGACYQYTDTATELTYLGNGLDYTVAVVDAKFGGSERIAGDSKVYAELEGLTEVTGGIQFFFRVYGAGSDKTATLYINGGEEIPTSVATLTGSATGGSAARSGNTITAVTPDSGSTLYSCIWAAATDGFTETDNLHLQLNLV